MRVRALSVFRLFAALFILLSVAASAYAGDEDETREWYYIKTVHEGFGADIENELEWAYENASMYSGVIHALGRARDQWNELRKEQYWLLIDLLDDEERIFLENEEASWVAFIEADKELFLMCNQWVLRSN